MHLDSRARMRKEFSASRTNLDMSLFTLFGPLDPVPQRYHTQNIFDIMYESRSKLLKFTLVLQEFFVRDVHETLSSDRPLQKR